MNKKVNGKKRGQMTVTNDNKTNGGGKIKSGKMEGMGRSILGRWKEWEDEIWEDAGNGKMEGMERKMERLRKWGSFPHCVGDLARPGSFFG